MGRNEEALTEYRLGLRIAQRLAASDPGNAERQRALSIVHSQIGDFLRVLGQRQDALMEFRRSLQIAEMLVKRDSGNSNRQFDLAASLFRVSTFLEPAHARPLVRRALAIVESLAQGDKLTAEQRDWLPQLRGLLATFPPEPADAQ